MIFIYKIHKKCRYTKIPVFFLWPDAVFISALFIQFTKSHRLTSSSTSISSLFCHYHRMRNEVTIIFESHHVSIHNSIHLMLINRVVLISQSKFEAVFGSAYCLLLFFYILKLDCQLIASIIKIQLI